MQTSRSRAQRIKKLTQSQRKKIERIPLERIGSPFVVRNWDKVTRRDATVHTPRTLENRVHFLREGSTGQLSRKRHLLKRTLSSEHSRAVKARSSIAVLSKVNAWAKHAVASNKKMHDTLKDHLQHHHHVIMLEDSIKHGKVGKLLMILSHCARNCAADGFRAEQVVAGKMHNGDPYLIAAVAKQRLDMARQLLLMGADVNTTGKPPNSFPCIIYAAMTGFISMIELLVDHGAVLTEHDLRLTKQKCGYSARGRSLRNEEQVRLWLHKHWSHKLMRAAQTNNADAVLVVLALNERASIYNERDHKRNAPIHVAAAHDNVRMVRLMLTHSRKTLELANGSYLKPLQVALIHDAVGAAQFLMARGARMNAAESRKMLEHHFASDDNTKLEYIETFASLVLHAQVVAADAQKVLPALSAHLKKLNSGAPSVLRQVAAAVASESFADYAKQHMTAEQVQAATEAAHGSGRHAIRDELIRNHIKHEQQERAKQQQLSKLAKLTAQQQRRPATTGMVRGMRGARSAATFVRPKTLFRKSQLHRLRTSRSMPQLTKSNIYISQTHSAKMLEIAQQIRSARVVFSQKLDSIIDHNVARMKSRRASSSKGPRRSRRTTTLGMRGESTAKKIERTRKARRASCF